jgi:hypothetical protein
VDTKCPQGIHKANCQACESYAVTFCEADYTACYSYNDGGETPAGGASACPYAVCRKEALQYMYDTLNRFDSLYLYIVMQ